MSKLSNALKVGALSLSMMVATAITVEAVNLHYFGNFLTIKAGHQQNARWMINGEMPVDGGFFTSTIKGKTIIAYAFKDKRNYLVEAKYRQNGKNSRPFFDKTITANTWSAGPNDIRAEVYSTDWQQSFWQSGQFFLHQLSDVI
ncbi:MULTISPECIES: hypothetical protein [Acidithiobacillus]|uniref:Uncharacterized protein n=1 Tax=Acidithiobacillus thiooxidans ATCC 19377 TaxID=637390 RepID=A0A543Q1X8_ACITH|nr:MULTISPECIES: hypothetical protein [Acidithiobacillus]MDD5280712.1 hypothetical protein [Acidithiobacillus sp.]MDX5935513.1 hypothetical protein [Acidithiobacillus thiooxidans]TQN50346.1 hypothetical protein DLNHIDIE_00199 [Acidithiobacillus thiooxidans ATCC 19377]